MLDVLLVMDQEKPFPAFGNALAMALKVERVSRDSLTVENVASARVIVLHCSLRRSADIARLAELIGEDRRKNDTIFVAMGSGRACQVQAEALGIERVLPSFRTADDIRAAVKAILWRDLSTHLAARSSSISKAIECGERLHRELGAAMRADRPLPPEVIGATARAICEATRRDGLGGWLDAVQFHHSRTCRHMLSVAGNGIAFGQHLGLHESDIVLIAEACLLHDVGKLFIPISVLEKDGPLSSAERRMINTHPARGAFALQRSGRDDIEVIHAVRDHHEFLDGTGYPNGLGGSCIRPLTRIVTLADIYSALTEERAYKAAMSPRQALTIMAEMKGKLDARLFTAFRSMVLAPVFTSKRGAKGEDCGAAMPCLRAGRHPLDRDGREDAA